MVEKNWASAVVIRLGVGEVAFMWLLSYNSLRNLDSAMPNFSRYLATVRLAAL